MFIGACLFMVVVVYYVPTAAAPPAVVDNCYALFAAPGDWRSMHPRNVLLTLPLARLTVMAEFII